MTGKLKGKQKKIDVNNNNRVDAQDLAMLRKQTKQKPKKQTLLG